MFFFNLEKVGRDFTLSGKEFFILVLKVYILKLGGQNWKTVGSLGNSIYFYKIENNMAPTYLSDCLPTTIGETLLLQVANILIFGYHEYNSHPTGVYLISILVFVKCLFVWSPFGMCC
jgi:hypothetical protein